MTCNLLHVLEKQDTNPYEDPDVKDVVGTMPQFYCTMCRPILRLKPGQAMKCLEVPQPCWMVGGPPCEAQAEAPTLDPWDPTRL